MGLRLSRLKIWVIEANYAQSRGWRRKALRPKAAKNEEMASTFVPAQASHFGLIRCLPMLYAKFKSTETTLNRTNVGLKQLEDLAKQIEEKRLIEPM